MICPGCGNQFTDEKLKSTVVSARHNHNASTGEQRRIIAVVNFYEVNTDDKANICRLCQEIVIGGLNAGKMFK